MTKPKAIKALDYTLSIEGSDGQFVPLAVQKVVPPEIPVGNIEITGTFTMDWVNRWKLYAYLFPPV